jgi:imidazole glycerol-phosphate synthase subunit HisF
MKRVRIIPVLLLKDGGLVKSTRFRDCKYVGDPVNAVKIFNEKEVDEVILLDIDASCKRQSPNFELISDIAGEAFVPLAYGGGINSMEHIERILKIGIEKVVLSTHAFHNPQLVKNAAEQCGSQSVVVCMEVKRNWAGKYTVFIQNGTRNTGEDPVSYAKRCMELGAGEIMINDIDRDGTFRGYDLQLLKRVSEAVNVPVVCCGGAGSLKDFLHAVKMGASAAAAGSFFVFQPPHRAVLITYPNQEELKREIYLQL